MVQPDLCCPKHGSQKVLSCQGANLGQEELDVDVEMLNWEAPHLRLDREKTTQKDVGALEIYTFCYPNVVKTSDKPVDFQLPCLPTGRAEAFSDRDDVLVSYFWNVDTGIIHHYHP